jgi:hypothetical protein
LGDKVRTTCAAPNDVRAVVPFRGTEAVFQLSAPTLPST